MDLNINIGQISNFKIFITKSTESKDGWTIIKPFIIIKLYSKDGLEGWGEAFSIKYREKAITSIIESLLEDISNIENLTIHKFRHRVAEIADNHKSLDFCAATSAIEIALWDISGKIKALPVHSILSKELITPVNHYTTCWSSMSHEDEIIMNRISEMLEHGSKAIKIYPFQNRNLDNSIKFVTKVSDLLGSRARLLLDLAVPNNFKETKKFIDEISPSNPYWIEEPVDGEDISKLVEVKNDCKSKIVTGEKQCGINHFNELILRNAADILNPDISCIGGLVEMLEISKNAKTKNIFISPHCWNSMSVSAAAMIHVCSVMPNSEMAEIFIEHLEHSKDYCESAFTIENDKLLSNKSPGLGIKIDEKNLSDLSDHIFEAKLNG